MRLRKELRLLLAIRHFRSVLDHPYNVFSYHVNQVYHFSYAKNVLLSRPEDRTRDWMSHSGFSMMSCHPHC